VRRNNIKGVHIGDAWCENLRVKEEIKNMFMTRFCEQRMVKVLLDNIAFPRISV